MREYRVLKKWEPDEDGEEVDLLWMELPPIAFEHNYPSAQPLGESYGPGEYLLLQTEPYEDIREVTVEMTSPMYSFKDKNDDAA